MRDRGRETGMVMGAARQTAQARGRAGELALWPARDRVADRAYAEQARAAALAAASRGEERVTGGLRERLAIYGVGVAMLCGLVLASLALGPAPQVGRDTDVPVVEAVAAVRVAPETYQGVAR